MTAVPGKQESKGSNHINDKDPQCDQESKGSNHINDKDVQSFFHFDPLDPYSKKSTQRRASLVIGDDGSGYGSILLCRFHNMPPELGKKRSTRELYRDLYAGLSNDGLERIRVGGSSGFITYSDELLKLMMTPNSTPRNSLGVLWLKDVDNLKWHFFYISTKVGEAMTWQYSNPKEGGQVTMSPKVFQKYNFLCSFVSTKGLAAAIVVAIGNTDISICPIAVKEELQNVAFTRKFIEQFSLDKNLSPQQKLGLFYAFYSENYLSYTLVQHPVGRHLDTFANGKPSLENRVCFSFLLRQNEKKGYGRGGAGMHRFCFALLDWESSRRKRSKCWTDPNNAHLNNSALAYSRMRNDVNQRCTDTVWNRFLENNDPSDIHGMPS
jgi:hypothetical protein